VPAYGTSVLRAKSRKKADAAWQRVVDMTDAQTKAIKEGRDRSNGVTAWQLLRQQLALALRTLRLRLRRTVPHCGTPGRTAHCALRQRQLAAGSRPAGPWRSHAPLRKPAAPGLRIAQENRVNLIKQTAKRPLYR
jgi:hypothetical protein